MRFSRWQTLLRLAGRALDAIGLPRFELHATLAPSDDRFQCYLEVTVDGQHRLGETELAHQLTEVQAIRAERTANALRPRRTRSAAHQAPDCSRVLGSLP